MQFGVRFQILLFSTSVRFSIKALAYLAYKAYKAYKACKAFMAFKAYTAFMAFKRSRRNPFQKYHAITYFSVDWSRTIRLVYASCKYFEHLHHKAPGNRKPKTLNLHRQPKNKYETTDNEFYKQKSRGSSCELALSVHDDVNHHQHHVISM